MLSFVFCQLNFDDLNNHYWVNVISSLSSAHSECAHLNVCALLLLRADNEPNETKRTRKTVRTNRHFVCFHFHRDCVGFAICGITLYCNWPSIYLEITGTTVHDCSSKQPDEIAMNSRQWWRHETIRNNAATQRSVIEEIYRRIKCNELAHSQLTVIRRFRFMQSDTMARAPLRGFSHNLASFYEMTTNTSRPTNSIPVFTFFSWEISEKNARRKIDSTLFRAKKRKKHTKINRNKSTNLFGMSFATQQYTILLTELWSIGSTVDQSRLKRDGKGFTAKIWIQFRWRTKIALNSMPNIIRHIEAGKIIIFQSICDFQPINNFDIWKIDRRKSHNRSSWSWRRTSF